MAAKKLGCRGFKVMSQSSCFNQPLLLHRLRVLIVDDDDDSSTLLMFTLQQCGAETAVATTAGAALELVKQFKPDILLSDIRLPDQDGYTLIRQIRALPAGQGEQIPAIAITGYAIPEVHDRALLEGFQQCLIKPLDLDELVSLVASFTGQVQPSHLT